jgi:hypothetical protein
MAQRATRKTGLPTADVSAAYIASSSISTTPPLAGQQTIRGPKNFRYAAAKRRRAKVSEGFLVFISQLLSSTF